MAELKIREGSLSLELYDDNEMLIWSHVVSTQDWEGLEVSVWQKEKDGTHGRGNLKKQKKNKATILRR